VRRPPARCRVTATSALRAAPTLALALALATVLAACGSSGPKRSAAPAVRAANPAITAAPTTTLPADQAKQRSEPYWVGVADLKGTGDTTTDPLTIPPGAIQWRVTFHCQKAPFAMVALRQSGEALKRPLADGASCGQEGKGFAAEAGTFRLKVTTPGTWDAKVEQQVDTPLVEPPLPAMATTPPVATAAVYSVDKKGEGSARLFRLPDGSWVIRLENFYVTVNSDLELRLSPLVTPHSTDDIAKAPYAEVGPLKATVGSMNYPVPADVDPTKYRSIVIWCEITRNAYAAAAL
jgi:hypothetical protein